MEHTKVFEVWINNRVYYVSASAKHKLMADLYNLRVTHAKVIATKRKYRKTGTTIFFNGTLESPITPSQLGAAISRRWPGLDTPEPSVVRSPFLR